MVAGKGNRSLGGFEQFENQSSLELLWFFV
jgi:hypothetical protein